jgi:hypothetical protein
MPPSGGVVGSGSRGSYKGGQTCYKSPSELLQRLAKLASKGILHCYHVMVVLVPPTISVRYQGELGLLTRHIGIATMDHQLFYKRPPCYAISAMVMADQRAMPACTNGRRQKSEDNEGFVSVTP